MPQTNKPFIPDDFLPATDQNSEMSNQSAPKKSSRRKFLKLGLAVGTAIPLLSAVDAFTVEPHWFEVNRHEISIPNLPAELAGLTISHITDIHIGEHTTYEQAREIVRLSNAQNPDLVVMTGDYITKSTTQLDPLIELFRDLKSKHGIFAVLGNHDYASNTARMKSLAKSADIELMGNEHRVLKIKGKKLCIAGVEDLWTKRTCLKTAMQNAPKNTPKILLCHNPDFAESMPRDLEIDLMISGHTHGGQVKIPFIGPVVLPINHKKYAEGLVQGPACKVFISRGLGMVGYPVRFNCKPEIPLLTIKPE